MSAGTWAVRVGAGLATASLGLTVRNLRQVRVPAPGPRPAPGEVAEPVAVLLPVRDEVDHVGVCVPALARAVRRWPGPARLVVLDDGSTDGTAERLRELVAQQPDGLVEVVAGAPTPPGWLGKPWACQQLADAAGPAAVLVFVDADVVVAEHAVTATVGLLRSARLDLVCPYPRQEAHGVAERLVQPLLQWSWLATVPLRVAERSPRASLAVANGQLLAVDVGAYRRAGGHGAVRAEVLEDLALLRAVKAVGGCGGVADGSDVASCRMYDGAAALRAGYTKSLWAAFGSASGAAGVCALLVAVWVVPPVAALRGSRAGRVGYAAGVAARVLVARRTGARAWPDAAAHPVSVLALVALTGESVLARRRGTLSWKGRPVEVTVGERG